MSSSSLWWFGITTSLVDRFGLYHPHQARFSTRRSSAAGAIFPFVFFNFFSADKSAWLRNQAIL
jgi:hypothetical protein